MLCACMCLQLAHSSGAVSNNISCVFVQEGKDSTEGYLATTIGRLDLPVLGQDTFFNIHSLISVHSDFFCLLSVCMSIACMVCI